MTYDQWKTESGYGEITPEQEREIEARQECKRRGLDPDDYAADGVAVWMVIDKELFEVVPLLERCPDPNEDWVEQEDAKQIGRAALRAVGL